MKKRVAAAVLLAGGGLVFVLALGPSVRGKALAGYLAFLTAVLVAAAARTIGRSLPPAPALLGRRPRAPRPEKPPKLTQIASIESRVSRGYGSAGGVTSHFRPLLVQVVSAELARKHGVVLEKQPERARALLGPRAAAARRPGGHRFRSSRRERAPARDRGGRANLMELNEVAATAGAVLDEVERAVVGKRDALELVFMGLLADGHVLLEDFPGLAKTLIARSFAATCRMRFARVQFTPDLMPADVTGSSIYDQRRGDFEFRPGPVFTNLLLADEINRAPPKTQAALLEAMQERQVTVEGATRRLERPFLVLATQNPIEFEGTYPLPEAQLDRFLLRAAVGYPAREDEAALLEQRLERRVDDVALEPVVDADGLREMQQAVEDVHVSEPARLYMVDLVAETRESPRVLVGLEPARLAGADEAVALPRCARRARLRHARRREGRRGARPRPPAHAPSRALGTGGAGRGRRERDARGGADAGLRMTRLALPKLRVYAALAGASPGRGRRARTARARRDRRAVRGLPRRGPGPAEAHRGDGRRQSSTPRGRSRTTRSSSFCG